MQESLVQWTLLNNLDYLSKHLDFKIASKKAQELSTNFGRIDFILEGYKQNQLLVELETTLNERSKLNYCFEQIKSYKNVGWVSTDAGYDLVDSDTGEVVYDSKEDKWNV